MSLVLDASAALAWVFLREDPAEAQYARAILYRLSHDTALVPGLWHLEVLNALVTAQRRGVITTAKASDFLNRLDDLPIQTHSYYVAARKEQLFGLAREHGLRAYDATYLDLAMRTGSSLATFDRKLAEAAETAGVSLTAV